MRLLLRTRLLLGLPFRALPPWHKVWVFLLSGGWFFLDLVNNECQF
jgi:hypothetical protein